MPDHYCQILLPLRLKWIPFYGSDVPLLPGQAVSVAFSGRRYIGIVWKTGVKPDVQESRIQNIIGAEDSMAMLGEAEMKLWDFVAKYYLCTLGEVYAAALPSLRIRSEQAAAARLKRLHSRLDSIEAELGGKHCERVRLRLEASREELLSRIRSAETARRYAPRPPKPDCAPPKPLLIRGYARTEIYVSHIRKALEQNGQVLLLTPETAFCERLEKLLSGEFGDKLLVVNSTRTAAERRRAADMLRSGEPALILGTRSAIFLPFNGLSLVIIDEEQDSFYKQDEPAPRYNGRDCAIYLAGLHSARVILGSACPSLESLLNCSGGKYELCEASPRPEGTAEIIDLVAERRKNGLCGPFSRKLIDAVLKYGGPVKFIRGWEKTEELQEAARTLFPGISTSISTLGELKRDGAGGASVLAVLQADALLSKDDFRSDEKALQMVAALRDFAPHLIIQSEVPQRFSPERYASSLLPERKAFGFPPYTRLVEIRRQGGGETVSRHFLKRDRDLSARKAEIFNSLPEGCYADVDPQ